MFNHQSNREEESQTLEKVSKQRYRLICPINLKFFYHLVSITLSKLAITIHVGFTNSDSRKSNGKVIFAKDSDINRTTAIEIEDMSK